MTMALPFRQKAMVKIQSHFTASREFGLESLEKEIFSLTTLRAKFFGEKYAHLKKKFIWHKNVQILHCTLLKKSFIHIYMILIQLKLMNDRNGSIVYICLYHKVYLNKGIESVML